MSDDAAAILLEAWGAKPPGGEQEPGFRGTLFLWTSNLGDVWREHEAYLRAVAARWEWTPSYWIAARNEYGIRFVTSDLEHAHHKRPFEGPYFYGEALAITGERS